MEEQMEQFFFGEGAKLPEGMFPKARLKLNLPVLACSTGSRGVSLNLILRGPRGCVLTSAWCFGSRKKNPR